MKKAHWFIFMIDWFKKKHKLKIRDMTEDSIAKAKK